jgi:hypothetical protein
MPQNGLFSAQLNEITKVLKIAGLYWSREYYPYYPEKPRTIFRNLRYEEIWRYCLTNSCYNFLLIDNSLLQFQHNNSHEENATIRYAYYECPYDCSTYQDYLTILGFDADEVRDSLRKEYEEYLQTVNLKHHVTPVRYDYSPDQYREGAHPASHIHFGHSSNIRLGTRKILNPLSFTCMIIRQFYPLIWEEICSHKDSYTWHRHIREHLSDVDTKYLKGADHHEMILS